MWNLLLLEDEPFVRRSIRQAIDWESLGFRVVAEAEDGSEAWAYMQTHPVDVVLSDIMMPVMNGIELLRLAKEKGHEVEFIMLTCVNEFEYARLALQYGAAGYLLKASMDTEELQVILQKTKQSLIKKREERTKAPMFNLYLKAWRSIHGKEELESNEVEVGGPPLPAYVRLFVGLATDADLGKDQIIGRFNLDCQDKLLVHRFVDGGIATVFVWSDEPDIPLHPSTTEPISSEWLTSAAWKEGWVSALQQIGLTWYGLNPSLHKVGELSIESFSWKQERYILQLFEAMQWVECEKALELAWHDFKDQQTAAAIVKETADRLDRSLARLSNQAPAGKAVWAEAASHQQALDLLLARIRLYSDHRMKPTISEHPEITKIIEYVNNNYDKELTLKGMAKYVNMGEQYLSGLFKKKTGEQFIQYVQRIRIERACFYLATTEMRVADICEQTGFVHLNYFLKQFKKRTGVTPSEFRESSKTDPK
ncbi:response regulator [Paenibacillus qinlingensis]|uniref:Two-component system response regulator YesN n=1 Tax=Paenibacillus qinlingensis TaxID=1837343 RepID=A0ABU1NXT9_9BACL|nr:response regulator [Paenibacillus qinlingensis]MDR6551886.1 two-component system response regulator YesN [Paenibacillus qinlingensis]